MIFAQFLANEHMPEGYKFEGTIDKKSLRDNLSRLAKDKPELYPDIVKNLKHTGDFLATNEGLSVGLDDITPDYKFRDKIIAKGEKRLVNAKSDSERIGILLDVQQQGLDHVTKNQGSLGRQVTSGSRGKPGQLMKTIFSPIVAKGKNDLPQPFFIKNSYAEGLTPGEFWTTAGESRRELATTQLATAVPGDTSKQINATLNNVLITKSDCGTRNGIEYSLDDPHIVERYEAGTNRLLSSDYIRQLKKQRKSEVMVRSPLTCKENPGVCQKCYGHNNEGQLHTLGTNVGLRSAQSLSEPLTQMILSAKHGGQMARSDEAVLSGTMGFRQFVDIPKIFKNQATLSSVAGKVDRIEDADHGGKYIHVGAKKFYVDPKRKPIVKPTQKIQVGQALSDGIPNPKEVVQYRGLGQGRKYMLDTIYDIYRGSGVDIDKRHVELLTKQDLNHVKINSDDGDGRFIRGDYAPYNKVREYLGKSAKEERVGNQLLGRKLGDETLHYTAGTYIDPDMLDAFKKNKIGKVSVTDSKLEFEPVMRPLEQVPLMSQDWVTRMSHRRIKDTVLQGAAQGWKSPIRGTAPYPAIMYGSPRFGETDEGHY